MLKLELVHSAKGNPQLISLKMTAFGTNTQMTMVLKVEFGDGGLRQVLQLLSLMIIGMQQVLKVLKNTEQDVMQGFKQ